jgi:hypothetical protein
MRPLHADSREPVDSAWLLRITSRGQPSISNARRYICPRIVHYTHRLTTSYREIQAESELYGPRRPDVIPRNAKKQSAPRFYPFVASNIASMQLSWRPNPFGLDGRPRRHSRKRVETLDFMFDLNGTCNGTIRTKDTDGATKIVPQTQEQNRPFSSTRPRVVKPLESDVHNRATGIESQRVGFPLSPEVARQDE